MLVGSPLVKRQLSLRKMRSRGESAARPTPAAIESQRTKLKRHKLTVPLS
jgi:hypothetical protein